MGALGLLWNWTRKSIGYHGLMSADWWANWISGGGYGRSSRWLLSQPQLFPCREPSWEGFPCWWPIAEMGWWHYLCQNWVRLAISYYGYGSCRQKNYRLVVQQRYDRRAYDYKSYENGHCTKRGERRPDFPLSQRCPVCMWRVQVAAGQKQYSPEHEQKR